MRRRLLTLVATAWLVGCAAPAAPSLVVKEGVVRLVTLGDSYTIGTSVGEADRWPNQLVAAIGDDRITLAGNPAVNGYTSRDVIERELPQLDGFEPQLVTLLIGVNDVVQDVADTTYAANLAVILDALEERLPADHVVCLATPDYTLTPQGAAYGEPARQRAGIVRVNALLRTACEQRGMPFVGAIFEISGRVAGDPSLVAGDGLHPSEAQYARWVEAIRPVVEALLPR